jgi:hypothetical protein
MPVLLSAVDPRKATALLVALAALALPAIAPGAGDGGAARQAEAFFVVPCTFTHRAPDDPIVFPGRPGASHLHDFFGNRATDAGSTLRGLDRHSTSCRNSDDRAAYWAPSLRVGGRLVRPDRAQVYYRSGGKDPLSIRAHPRGLRIVAGSARARSPQSRRITVWHCGPDAGQTVGSEVPSCAAGQRLRLRVRFPDCWDGRSLDSPDHQSHMAYSAHGACPRSHPVALPLLSMNVRYPVAGGRGVELSSGGVNSAHADFLNAWRRGAMERLVRRCIRAPGMGNKPPCTPFTLRIGVSPRRPVAGRRTRLRVRVSIRDRGRTLPVRRALVRVAGRRARTDRRGRASLIVRFGRPGRRALKVSARDLMSRKLLLRVR